MSLRASWFTSSSTGRTPFVGESPTIGGPELAPADRAGLLALARAALDASFTGSRDRASVETLVAAGTRAGLGAFVTLAARGELRGCIGRLRSHRPLAEVVCELAVAAAREDDRFPPLTHDELRVVRIEISVLGEPTLLDPAAVEGIAIGRDGLMVRRGSLSAVLLPQVAREHGWNAEAFLTAVCRKAGLAAHAWREPTTEVLAFQADVFAEQDEG